MDFEVGKCYQHEAGRYISICGEVMTDRWGKMFAVEECDNTGVAISCAEIKECTNVDKKGWIEVSRGEWLEALKVPRCGYCQKEMVENDEVIPTTRGHVHKACFVEMFKEQGAGIILPEDHDKFLEATGALPDDSKAVH